MDMAEVSCASSMERMAFLCTITPLERYQLRWYVCNFFADVTQSLFSILNVIDARCNVSCILILPCPSFPHFVQKSDPIVPGSLIEIASCTKLIVACAIAQLVENGSLSYTTTLGDLFRLGEKFPIPAGMLVIDGKDYSSYITIQALLSHRSGLVDYWTDPNRDGDKSTGKDNAFLTAFNK